MEVAFRPGLCGDPSMWKFENEILDCMDRLQVGFMCYIILLTAMKECRFIGEFLKSRVAQSCESNIVRAKSVFNPPNNEQ